MENKVNAFFDNSILSQPLSFATDFALANESDIPEVTALMLLRNPLVPYALMESKVAKEVSTFSDGKRYGLFVAKVENKVVGFSRFYFSEDVPKEKVKFPFRQGCHCMGMMVHPDWRRKSIAKFMSEQRESWMKKLGAHEVFSVVANDNPTSLAMHKRFGFSSIEKVKGYLNISFDCGEGILFHKEII